MFFIINYQTSEQVDSSYWSRWVEQWSNIQNAVATNGWEVRDKLIIEAPASFDEVHDLQTELNIILPDDFVAVLTQYSRKVAFTWYTDGKDFPGIYRQLFSGGSDPLWDLDFLAHCKADYNGWIRECFSNPNDPGDAIWHNKVPFIDVPNGDMIAFDVVNGSQNCPVIYLSHELDDMHGKRLGYNFIDFITRWSNIGCPGTEDWQLEPFYDKLNNTLKLDGIEVGEWKKLTGF